VTDTEDWGFHRVVALVGSSDGHRPEWRLLRILGDWNDVIVPTRQQILHHPLWALYDDNTLDQTLQTALSRGWVSQVGNALNEREERRYEVTTLALRLLSSGRSLGIVALSLEQTLLGILAGNPAGTTLEQLNDHPALEEWPLPWIEEALVQAVKDKRTVAQNQSGFFLTKAGRAVLSPPNDDVVVGNRCRYSKCRAELPGPGPKGGRPPKYCKGRSWPPAGKDCQAMAAAEVEAREVMSVGSTADFTEMARLVGRLETLADGPLAATLRKTATLLEELADQVAAVRDGAVTDAATAMESYTVAASQIADYAAAADTARREAAEIRRDADESISRAQRAQREAEAAAVRDSRVRAEAEAAAEHARITAARAEGRASALQVQLDEARAQLDNQARRIDDDFRVIGELRSERDQARADLERVQADLDNTKVVLAEAERMIADGRIETVALRTELGAALRTGEVLTARLTEAREEAEVARTKLAVANDRTRREVAARFYDLLTDPAAFVEWRAGLGEDTKGYTGELYAQFLRDSIGGGDEGK
jgi:hypothetical protein